LTCGGWDEALNGVGVDRADYMLACVVIYDAVIVCFIKMTISGIIVSAKQTDFIGNGFIDEIAERDFVHAKDNASNDIALSFNCANRLAQLYSKRLSRKKLTPEEDAEEAHLAVRVLNPKAVKPEVKAVEWDLKIEWPTTRIAELDERVVGGETLTAAEEAERQDLRRRYPQSAAQADRLDHRYRYWKRRSPRRPVWTGQRHIRRRGISASG
jgi:hypothetical protein